MMTVEERSGRAGGKRGEGRCEREESVECEKKGFA